MKWISKVAVVGALAVAAVAAYAGSVRHADGETAPVIAGNPAALNTLIDVDEKLTGLVALLSKPGDDNVRFCYFDGESFSEGAVREGRVCRRWADNSAGAGSGTAHVQRPLVWADK